MLRNTNKNAIGLIREQGLPDSFRERGCRLLSIRAGRTLNKYNILLGLYYFLNM